MKQTGSGNKGLDWVIIFGMIAAYPKTADLLSYWSPAILSDITGPDIPTGLLYGLFCAAMVEGTIIFLHFDRRTRSVFSAQAVKWILIAVSFACQIFDGFVTQDTVSQMSPFLRSTLTYGIPALPLIIAVMVSTITLPDTVERKPFKGLRNYLPNKEYILNGEKQNTEFSPSPAEVVQTQLKEDVELPKPPNGQEKETVNPTIGKRK